MKPVLVLGVGNLLLKDEGVGVHVIRAMEGRTVPDEVEVYDGGTFGLDLLDVLAGRRRVIVVDAVQPAGGESAGQPPAPPGTVLRFTADDLVRRGTQHGNLPCWVPADLSLHQIGLFETLSMARRLGCAPGEVVLFGIVPKDMSPGLDLTAEVAAVVPQVVDLVLAEVGKDRGPSESESV
jgi:hydrogenase maturation protease